jgi:hypothetical protein
MNKVIITIVFILGAAGCATNPFIRDSHLHLDVEPHALYCGKPALAEINAPLSAKSVIGYILVPGAPELIFRKNQKEKLWYFYGIVPVSPWIIPGSYKVRVVVKMLKGLPHYTETQVDLK